MNIDPPEAEWMSLCSVLSKMGRIPFRRINIQLLQDIFIYPPILYDEQEVAFIFFEYTDVF